MEWLQEGLHAKSIIACHFMTSQNLAGPSALAQAVINALRSPDFASMKSDRGLADLS